MKRLIATVLTIGFWAAPAPCVDIHFPPFPPSPTPLPPPPAPAPDAVQKLPADQLFVVDSDQPVILLASPVGLVNVTPVAGPATLFSKFVGGAGQLEARTFKGPSVYVVRAVQSGRCELLAVPAGATAEAAVVRRTLDVFAGDTPEPPVPGPGPNPDPFGDVSAAGGLKVLLVYESADLSKYPATQVAAMTAGAVRDYLDTHCVTAPDGKTKAWRMWDQNVDASDESPLWQKAMKRPRKSLPWLIVGNGKSGYEGPMPATADGLLKLLKTYGGL